LEGGFCGVVFTTAMILLVRLVWRSYDITWRAALRLELRM